MADKCSQVGTAFDPDRQCGSWASHVVDGKPYCRHHPAQAAVRPQDMTLLDGYVWDALKQSRCPAKHRYRGPSGGLPCRWCRTGHAILIVLDQVKAGKDPDQIRTSIERQLGWTLNDPPVGLKAQKKDIAHDRIDAPQAAGL